MWSATKDEHGPRDHRADPDDDEQNQNSPLPRRDGPVRIARVLRSGGRSPWQPSASISSSNAQVGRCNVTELLGIARFKFHEGKVEEYKRLSARAMDIVRTKDSGTLQFDIYLNDDESECMVIERYRDSDALIEHSENLGELSEAILAIVSVVHGEVLGEVSAELRAKLADSPVQPFRPHQSM
jgi:quinol monooxygenase YgiN